MMDITSDKTARVFDGSCTTVSVVPLDGGGPGSFDCDEEPHMLSPELGYGYYPLNLGQRLETKQDKTYEIVRKLAWAGYSSVWLAVICDDIDTQLKYAVIKVLTVDATAAVLDDVFPEDKILRRITRTNKAHTGYLHVLKLRHAFVTFSHHGPHLCFTSNVLGSDLISLRRSQPNKIFSVPATKRIIRQTLLALDYLHRDCELVHTDVKPGNTLVCIEQSAAAITEHLSADPSTTYEPRVEPRLSPNPIVTVKSQPLPNLGLNADLSNLAIQLVDYGQAILLERLPWHDDVQPTLLRAPEVILGYSWSTPIDIWSIGCLVFEYLIGAALFKLYETEEVTCTDVHLKRIIEHIGPFPESFLAGCSRRDQYFDKDGQLLRVKTFVPRSLDECLRNYNDLDKKDIAPAADFMRRCLTIDPTQRPTALELLEDEWLKDA